MQRQRGDLVPIGDAVSGLRSPVTTEPKTKLIAATFAGVPGTVTVSLTKIGPSWWNRMRKLPVVDWITKLISGKLIGKLIDWVCDFVAQLFQRVRTASDAHGRSHAA